MSKYEDYITSIFKKNKIKFYREKTFSDLKQGLFRFDFYIYDLYETPVIVEVDGE